jgi:hypothetical protein
VYQELKPAKEVGMTTVLIGRQAQLEEWPWVDWQLDRVHRLPVLVKGLQ